jgi:fatty-acyl-CoA synthase
MSIYDTDLPKCPANYQPLTPLSFLQRSAQVYPDRIAIIHGKARVTYRDFYARARKLASALKKAGVKKGDTVSVLLANTPAMLECHYGVPMIGAVLNTLNTRLDAATIGFSLDHGEAKVFIVDKEHSKTGDEAVKLMKGPKPIMIDYVDPEYPVEGARLSSIEYEDFISSGDPEFAWTWPADEWDAISLNYTSGTTGNPKGVYLWTLPMFHCNGWCFPWSISVVGGTHVTLRWVRSNLIWQALADHKVTHLCGAPIVMSTIVNAPESEKRGLDRVVEFFTAAAPPPEAVLKAMAEAGFNVTHLYGLTETYGPAVVNDWKTEWDALDGPARATRKARQGVRYHALEDLNVMDSDTMAPVATDGTEMGEVMFRGNVVMKGYLKNRKATEEAFRGGWFHSGDLGVTHADTYVQLKDRSKDIIISGGENISSIEVEDCLYKHPAVQAAAVVAKEDEKWGEVPCAFVELKPGKSATQEDIIEWCRKGLAKFKVPKYVAFIELPKTSTGKIQKFKLRETAKGV